MQNTRTIVNTRSGVWSGVLAGLVFTRYYLENTAAWNIAAMLSPELLGPYLDGLWQAVFGTGAAAAVARDQISGKPPVHRPLPIPPAPTAPRVKTITPTVQTSWSFGRRSNEELSKCHPKIIDLMTLALRYSPVDFGVTEGWRSIEKQRQYVADGISPTLKSAHTLEPSLAVDIIAYDQTGTGTWAPEYYERIAIAVERAATELGIAYIWGGAWKSRDLVHFELDRNRYSDYLQPDINLA